MYWIHQAQDMNTWGGVGGGEHGNEISATIQGGEFM